MYDLKKVIEANTKDEVIDYEAIMNVIDNEYVNPIVAKKADESKLMPKAVASVIKELGIDGESIDDAKLYIKQLGGSTDEVKEENLKLMKQVKELEKSYNETVEAKTKMENDLKDKSQTDLIKSLGVTDEKQIKFLKWDFNNQVNEEKDFETVVAEYAKENKITTTTKFIKDDFGFQGNEQGIDIGDAFEKLRKHK